MYVYLLLLILAIAAKAACVSLCLTPASNPHVCVKPETLHCPNALLHCLSARKNACCFHRQRVLESCKWFVELHPGASRLKTGMVCGCLRWYANTATCMLTFLRAWVTVHLSLCCGLSVSLTRCHSAAVPGHGSTLVGGRSSSRIFSITRTHFTHCQPSSWAVWPGGRGTSMFVAGCCTCGQRALPRGAPGWLTVVSQNVAVCWHPEVPRWAGKTLLLCNGG